jgi:hypothetical protein
MVKIIPGNTIDMVELTTDGESFVMFHREHVPMTDVDNFPVVMSHQDYTLVGYRASGHTTHKQKDALLKLRSQERNSWALQSYDFVGNDWLTIAILSNYDAERIEIRNASFLETDAIYEIYLNPC